MHEHPPTAEPLTSAEPVIWRCAVPSPLRRLLDYLAIPGATPPPGTRLRVPLGSRLVTAILVEVGTHSSITAGKLRRADAVLDETPLLDHQLLQLLAWVSRYYVHPPGEVYPLALGPRERRGEPPAPLGVPGLQLSLRGRGLPVGALSRAPKQAALLALLQAKPQPMATLKQSGISASVIRELISKGLAERCDMALEPAWQARQALTPGTEQAAAIAAITERLGGFHCHVLQGITGSGKTEVYLQAMAQTLARGEQALLLLPEIALTPQMMERVRERFDAPVVELHSGLGDGRDRGWSAARWGSAAVVVGTRSAVFVPLAKPGLIIVDEEHESSFTQQDGLRYSARDVAIKRAQLANCPVVLGSATPSLETLDNVSRGRFERSLLRRRAGVAAPPQREIIDIRGLALSGGLTPPLMAAVQDTLRAGEQALLFINRRGFAQSLVCHDCGWVSACANCDARLAVHRQPPRLLCHHCSEQRALPRRCPGCGGPRLLAAGVGTEQTEQAIVHECANFPILRIDSDSVRTRQAMAALRQQIAHGDPMVLIGTQMLAKGHDFPRVTLVGILDADSLLFSPDFRGEERLLQLLTQVAGRAGRGERPGRVLIQTHHPEHPLIKDVLAVDYEEQALTLLQARRQRGLPPAGALALLRTDSPTAAAGLRFLDQVLKQAGDLGPCRMVGPLHTPMARRAGLVRCQLIVSGPDRPRVGAIMRRLVSIAEAIKPEGQLRWFVDIDPIDPI